MGPSGSAEGVVDAVSAHQAFYVPVGDGWLATPLTRGPWDGRFQHGGPPSALATGALARFGDDASAWFLARVTVELLRPVPLGRVELEVVPERLGRGVQRLEAVLSVDGRPVLAARGLRIRRERTAVPAVTMPAPWPDPDACGELVFSFFRDELAYHRAVALRTAHGVWGSTPIGVWGRPRVPLVAGRPDLPRERVLVLADAQSGMGVPLDPASWSFVNPDLTVYFERDPLDGWLGYDIRSTACSEGVGLAQSAIRDRAGLCARAAQSLFVAPRGA